MNKAEAPPVFGDADKALTELIEAKRKLDAARENVRQREQTNAQTRVQRSYSVRGPDGVDRDFQREQGLIEPLVVAQQRARAEYEVAFAIYQEAAGRRETKRLSALTFWIAVAAVVQAIAAIATITDIVHKWSK
jgi:hypothetical protein